MEPVGTGKFESSIFEFRIRHILSQITSASHECRHFSVMSFDLHRPTHTTWDNVSTKHEPEITQHCHLQWFNGGRCHHFTLRPWMSFTSASPFESPTVAAAAATIWVRSESPNDRGQGQVERCTKRSGNSHPSWRIQVDEVGVWLFVSFPWILQFFKEGYRMI